ncbi:MAG: adenylyltransferase/cytidyltransferase family protein [Verrucomicrobiota bacterium]|nr:adenylyltransferase/cytidyltransferase family protein [Limisphaera sp.]MDW8380616.1 adenylyltransferase/cytidyltransferase family protein [Verrucomicrobiota bacterium]
MNSVPHQAPMGRQEVPTGSRTVWVAGPFDDLRSHHVRFLQEAARIGRVTVFLWTDEAIREYWGRPPKFPFPERQYLLAALRYVHQIVPVPSPGRINPNQPVEDRALWLDPPWPNHPRHAKLAHDMGLEYRCLAEEHLRHFPLPDPLPVDPSCPKVVVTGCYDWLHSGHVRFFEEARAYGQLFVIIGHDANIRTLKGPGHPLQSENERRFMVASIRHVTATFISSGQGWLDADPEIRQLRPQFYVVNEDGDKGGKRQYCERMGIQYIVLKRVPAPGLPARSSTQLRGF